MFSPEEIEKTRQLLELFGSNKLSELSISESGGFSVEIIASSLPVYAPVQAVRPQLPQTIRQPQPSTSTRASAGSSKSNLRTLNSPMVGIFYASASPGDPPFVNIGDVVAIGQTIGLIEAMKVFSEIPAEAAGRIVEITAVTGTLVQQSEPLFRIEPA